MAAVPSRSSPGTHRQGRPGAIDQAGTWQLLSLLRDGRPRTRTEIGVELGIARSTVASRLEALIAGGFVGPAGDAASSGGRPPSTFVLNHAARVGLVAHVGPDQIRMALTDLDGRILTSGQTQHVPEQGPGETLTAVITAASEMLTGIGRRPGEISGIGIGLPGIIDHETGRPVESQSMPGWNGFDIIGHIRQSFAVPVMVENEINLIATHERLSGWRDHPNFLYVHLDGCANVAIFSAGKLQRGSTGTAGILTTLPARNNTPHPCHCGTRACLGHTESPAIAASIRETGRSLGELLATAVTILNPSAIVIGGKVKGAGQHLIAGIREVIFHRSPPAATFGLTISLAGDGDDAALHGLSRIVVQHIMTRTAIGSALQPARPDALSSRSAN